MDCAKEIQVTKQFGNVSNNCRFFCLKFVKSLVTNVLKKKNHSVYVPKKK